MDPPTRPRRNQAVDYLLLNDGYEGDEPTMMENILPGTAQSPVESSIDMGPEDSISQIGSQTVSTGLTAEAHDLESSPIQTASNSSQRTRGTSNSWLWEQFEITTLSQQWRPKRSKKLRSDQLITCKHCQKWSIKDSARSTSTTNMSYHLQKSHGLPLGNDKEDTTQPTIMTMWKRKETANTAELFEKNLIRWVVQTRQPFTVIESPAFVKLFKDIPGVDLRFTSRKTLKLRIDSEFELCRANLKRELDSTCRTISLSLDVWTSQNQKAILGVIGHWLSEDFEYKERVLEFEEFVGVHSGDNMAQIVLDVLKELDLTKKLIAVTADNASNNGTFVETLGFMLEEEGDDVRFRGREDFISCLAHVLNLIVKDILKSLKPGDTSSANEACDQIARGGPIGSHSALSRLRILSLWILRTPQRREGWKNLCSVHGLNDKYIQYDVDNRWNSTYRMLQDGLSAKEQIRHYLNAIGLLPPFTSSDWRHLEQIARVLEKFDEFTKLVSTKGLSISLSIGIYYELHDLLENATTRQEDFADLEEGIACAVAGGLQKYRKYYEFLDKQDAYYVALLLDPRFKAELLKAELNDEEDANFIVKSMRERLNREYPSLVPDRVEAIVIAEKPSLESRMLAKLAPRKVQRSDIDKYFEEETVAVAATEEGWLLKWWRAHKDEYPRMAAAARDYLAIPASEVAVERLFSGGRDLLGLRRHSMDAGTMRKLTLLADYYSTQAEL